MLQPGDRIPEATVWVGPRELHTIAEIVEDGPVLLVFYLFDWSSTCTNELDLLGGRSAEFEEAGVRVFGISRDSPWTHIAWMQALDLQVPLLSDWNAEATKGFGIVREYRGMRDVAERTAFLIDGKGEVRCAWSYENDVVPDFDEILAAARAL